MPCHVLPFASLQLTLPWLSATHGARVPLHEALVPHTSSQSVAAGRHFIFFLLFLAYILGKYVYIYVEF